jgi:mono/diheme cytochrome c family protein
MKKMLVLCGVTAALVLGCKEKKEEQVAPQPAKAQPEVTEARTPEPPPGPDPEVVERGAYLAKAGGCLVCHTGMGPHGPDLANVGAGGLEMVEKFGTWRSPNITPDKATGIGSWTDDQIAAAIREGVRPDGKQLYPIMPYMNYNGLTDDDVKALVTFLRTLKPVEKVVAKNDLKMAAMPAPRPANKAPGDDPVAKGAYLGSIMLCSHCHWTPNKDFSAPVDLNHLFSGGLPMELPPMGTGTLFSANITSDPDTGIGKWTEEQIFTSIKMMQKPDGKMIQGPMLFMQGMWAQLEDQDLENVAAWIKTLPPVKNKVAASTFKPHAGPPGSGPSK